MPQPDTAEPAKLYSNAFRSLKRRAENGHQLTLAEIEAAVEADPASRRAFEQMAEETRAGRDITVEEFARRARIPVEFAVLLVVAFISGMAIGHRSVN